ncbi:MULTISPECIES: UPF0182 family membrane protein [Nocardioides]|uniref:UPF0182 family membrane protein n=1 Tax=Nocardioides TaxID=1839 RepID=UPI00032DB981|nr:MULTISPECIES: UPF0182 family protein [Nocardioides]EON24697.1 hypothetical protein CF8_1274 [Nocardioides sp. CF8]
MFDAEPERHAEQPPPARTGRSRTLIIAAAVLVVLFLSLTGIASFWTERLWFKAAGFGSVFQTLLWTRIGLFLVFGGVMAAVVALNLALAYRARPMLLSGGDANLARYREAVAPVMGWLFGGVSALMGIFAGASASGQWREFSLWRHSSPFGHTDPYFNRDAGFYVFELPWWHYLTDFVMALAVIGLMAAALVHYLYGGIRLSVPRDRLSGAAQVHLSALLGVFVLAKAADYWLDRFDLVTGSGSLFTGMGYTDDHAVLPAKEILTGIALICAVLFFLNIWRRTWLLPSMGIALLALSAVLLGLIVPGVVQQFQVSPNVPDKEGSYIKENIDATRLAFNLDDIEVTPYSSDPATSGDGDLAALDAGTSSVPLVDPKIVSQTFEQEQQVRAYYSVPNVLDVDRYEIDGTDRALVLGVRELDQAGLADSDKNWSNLHTVYTHGNGVIAAYANQRPQDDAKQSQTIEWAEGQETDESALTNLTETGYESRVYYGETSPSYSIVGQKEGGSSVELDLPKGERDDENQTTSYDGAGGVPIGNLLDKVLYAVRFGEPNLVLSGRVHEDSKILYDRNPRRMVEKVAPWLTVDSDPYPAVIDGKIQWILDGYTVTDRFPLSQRESLEDMTDDSLTETPGFQTLPTDEINYMRNAVKATVDAYDGTVHIYAWDEEDPILKAWSEVFPDVVEPKSAIPDSLLSHLRYPDDLFKAQRHHFARYHLTDAKDWYDGANRWAVPKDPQDDSTQQPPYRLFLDDTWALTSVYVPREKNNLASFMSVNSDAESEDYGQITVLELPNERTAGPGQIANEISSDEDVREEVFSFSQGNVTPVYGNLLTLPVSDGLMYVQPLYAKRSGSESSFPILRFVLVSYGDKVGIGRSLREAIADVLGVSPVVTVPEPDPEPDPGPGEPEPEQPTGSVDDRIRSLLAQAEAKFDAADRAQTNGNSVGWARLMEEGRDLITQAVELAESRD